MDWGVVFVTTITTVVIIAVVAKIFELRKDRKRNLESSEPINSKDMMEDSILVHLRLQADVRNDILESEYVQDEIGDIENLLNVYNLALGLHYLSVAQQEELSSITEAAVSQFIRNGYESYGDYRAKERELNEDID